MNRKNPNLEARNFRGIIIFVVQTIFTKISDFSERSSKRLTVCNHYYGGRELVGLIAQSIALRRDASSISAVTIEISYSHIAVNSRRNPQI